MSSQVLMQLFSGNAGHADYEDSVLRFNIKAYLAKSSEVNQASLAKKFGITTAGMSQKINKPGRLTVRDAVIIADELGVTLNDLLDDKEMIKEVKRQSEEASLLMKLSDQMRGSNRPAYTATGARYFVSQVPPLGFEPRTHDLKGRLDFSTFLMWLIFFAWVGTSSDTL